MPLIYRRQIDALRKGDAKRPRESLAAVDQLLVAIHAPQRQREKVAPDGAAPECSQKSASLLAASQPDERMAGLKIA